MSAENTTEIQELKSFLSDRFNKLDAKFEFLTEKVNSIDKRLVVVETKIDSIEQKVTATNERISEVKDTLSGTIDDAECAVRQAPEFNSGEPDRTNTRIGDINNRLNITTIGFLGIVGVLVTGILGTIGKLVFFSGGKP